MKKKVIVFLIILIIVNIVFYTNVFANDTSISSWGDTMKKSSDIETGTNIAKTINSVIGLIQIAGTGIALIVVTMMGIKYLLAAPSEKADTKKMILPVIIGCVLLFGAVNLVGNMADLAGILNS